MKLWRADNKQLRPVLVDCPHGGHPAADADGVPIYENTHFRTEGEAWKSLCRNAEAGVSLAGSNVEVCRLRLDDANVRAAEAAVEFARVRDHYRDWVREQANQPDEDDQCDE